MISFIKAIVYALFHPYDIVNYTVVRRYVDAQKNFIGELYEGDGRDAKMIGATCDNLPFNVGFLPSVVKCFVCWSKDFTAPLGPNTVRIGGFTPAENAPVREAVSLKRFCTVHVTVLNRFVEHILESDHV